MRKYIFILLAFTILGISNLFAHGLAVHISQYDKYKQYYWDKSNQDYEDPDPYMRYYMVMEQYPAYVKWGMMLPDMVYVNTGREVLRRLYQDLEDNGAALYHQYQVDLTEIPDPNDPDIGALSFGIDTHDYRYAMQFAEYLLRQASADPDQGYTGPAYDPPGIDPGGTGENSKSRGHKLAVAIGYYIHMCQDLIAHNYWVPKLTAQSGLGELSMIELKDTGSQLDVIPGIQAHYAIETMHDYRLGSAACQDVANVVTTFDDNGTTHDDFYIRSGSVGVPVQTIEGFTFDGTIEPLIGGGVYYPATENGSDIFYTGVNPALHFFWKVLQDWYNNNPMGLSVHKSETAPLINFKGFVDEAHMWQFVNRFFRPAVGHGNFASEFANYIEERTTVNVTGNYWVDETLRMFGKGEIKAKFLKKLIPQLQHGFASSFQLILGIMKNDPDRAEELALQSDTPINYSEYQRLKSNPVFTDPNYFNGFSYYEDLGIQYFDEVGEDGKIYTDWAPEYFYPYFWGVINSLNGDDQFDRRSDFGVYDSWFVVNGERFGPGVEASPFEGNSFKAGVELYAFEEMTSPVTVTARIKLDHINNAPAFDPIIKTDTFIMQQDPAKINTVGRKRFEISFSSADMTGLYLPNYKGAYLELSVISNRPFYSTDWDSYSTLSNAQNRRYEVYDTYNYPPYSYPNGFAYPQFTNMNKYNVNIGGTVEVNGETIGSGETFPVFHNVDVDAIAQEHVFYSEDGVNYKHHNWNNNDINFKLNYSFNAASTTVWDYDLKFFDPINIAFDSDGGDVNSIQINDPWYVEKSGPDEGKRLDRYHRLDEDPGFNGSDYEVFKELDILPGKKHYTLTTNAYHATNDGIYEFSGWDVTPASGATFEDASSHQSAVVFNEDGATITAVYDQVRVNTISNYTATIDANTELTIPAGANITFADGFTFDVQGSLTIGGTETQPVILTGSGRATDYEPLEQASPGNPVLPQDYFIQVNGSNKNITLNNVKIKNTYCGIDVSGSNNTIDIKNTTFENTNVGLLLGRASQSGIYLEDNTFNNNHSGIVFNKGAADNVQETLLSVYRNVFSNNEYGIYYFPTMEVTGGTDSKFGFVAVNNTFYNNSTMGLYIQLYLNDVNQFGYLYGFFANNLYSNNAGDFSYSAQGPQIFYSYWRGDALEGADPSLTFNDATAGDFHLQYGSPAIDGGSLHTLDLIEDGSFNFDMIVPTQFDWDNEVYGEPDRGAYFYPQTNLSGALSANTTLEGAVNIAENLNITNNATLTINPGTALIFEAGERLIIEAGSTLDVNGTASAPVTFKSSGVDKWYGIKFEENASASSSIEYAQIENASNGIYVYKSNPTIKNNTIKNITYKAVYLYRSSSLVQKNLIKDSKYGVYVSQSNYISDTPNITDNTINNCTYGIRLYSSSPNILRNDILGDNGPSSTSYGIYCSSSSAPNLGYMGDPGNNYIHGTNKGLNASSSSPFLGEEYCADNGGYNRFENNDLHIYAYGTSTVLAENNWWGSPSPSSSLFSTGSPAVIDYMPWLTSSPSFNTQVNGSPETVSFDNSLGKMAVSSENTVLTETEAMANFDENWPLLRQLKFANNLVQLSFPESAYNICKNIISSAPDSNLAYLAFDILWKAGRADDESFTKFRNYTDSLSQLEYQEEIEEHAQFVDEEYDDEDNLGKKSGKNALGYLGYKHPRIAANFLFRDLESTFVANDNRDGAMDIFKIMVTEFPDEAATFEAKMLLGIDEDIDIEKEFNIPLEYKLSQNYPNPFNLETTFEFGLPKASDIKIEIFNAIGQKVKTIERNNLFPGYHKILWNGRDEFSNVVASGMYIFKFRAVSILKKIVKYEKVRKMLLIK